jgi:TIR domain
LINVSAPAAPPGYRATITGAGFLNGEAIAIYLDSPDRPLATTFADSSGAFRRDVTIPNGTPAGIHSICVQQQPLPRCVPFTVQAIAPPSTPTPSPTPMPTPTPTSSPAVLAPAPTSAATTAWPGRLLANVGAPAASGGAILLLLALALAAVWLLRRRGLTWAVGEASPPRAPVSPEAPPQPPEGGHPPIASRIFVCYRREDSGGHTGRIYDQLAPHFARGQVFMDIETIEPGLDFTQVVGMAVDASAVVVAVIGRSWLSVTDEHGHRRLDNPDDYVRHELSAALARDIRVIPVLVQGASMPGASELPDPLKPLARRNAIELSDTRWKFDVGVLIKALESAIAQVRREAEMSRSERRLLQ